MNMSGSYLNESHVTTIFSAEQTDRKAAAAVETTVDTKTRSARGPNLRL